MGRNQPPIAHYRHVHLLYNPAAGRLQRSRGVLLTRLKHVIEEQGSAITGCPTSAQGAGSHGVFAGLRLDTTRGDVLKGILEGTAFYLKERTESLPAAGIQIDEFRAVGGGSRSEAWIQISADILGRPFVRPGITEAGTLGAAIMAGVGVGVFPSFEVGVESAVRLDRTFEPRPTRQKEYAKRFEKHKRLRPLMAEYLRDLA